MNYALPMLGYLGPEGTFTHQALKQLLENDPTLDADEEIVAYSSVIHALDAVREGKVSGALVPIENSVEGGVSATLDYLADPTAPLQIIRETVLQISFNLCVRPGTKSTDIKRVISHPHALAQVRNWLSHNLPDAVIAEGGSTAAAAELVSDPNSGFDAAVCSAIAGEMYGLEALETGIADNQSAETRFVLVTMPQPSPRRTGRDKTTLVAYMRKDQPGALLDILQQLAGRGVNLCRIESRPTKTTLGSYCFSIDAEGHIQDMRMADALIGLKRVCQDVVFLGSYERADKKPPLITYGGRDDDYTDAIDWARRIGAQI